MRYSASERAEIIPACRAVTLAGQAYAGQTRHPASHILSLVRPLW